MASHSRPMGHLFCLDHLKEETRFICKTCKIPLCDECVASIHHKGHEIESIKKHAEGKYSVLQDFENEACNHIEDIKDKEESADKDFEEVLQLIESRLKSTEDHGEYLKGLIDSHMLTTKTEYNTIRDSFKNHYQHYKSETGDALQTLNRLIKESKDAKKSDSNNLIVDVPNDEPSREFSFPKYTKPKVNNFNFGSGPKKHIQSSFGYIARKFMATPEVNTKIEMSDPPLLIRRTYDDCLIITYGTNMISIVDSTGTITKVESDVPIEDIAMHPTTGQMFCLHKDRDEFRSLNSNTGKTQHLFNKEVHLDQKPRFRDTNQYLQNPLTTIMNVFQSPIRLTHSCRLAVSHQGNIIIGERCSEMSIYSTEGALLQNVNCTDIPRHITVCRSTGKIAVACERGGVMILDANYQHLYQITSGNFAEFDRHGYVIIGDLDTKRVRFYNATAGELQNEIEYAQLFQGRVQCLCIQDNGDLVVGTKNPNELQFIKYLQ